ncbi:MAG: phosphoribosylanthranilate isomerase [Desulfovibrionaceae bacterium]|nr:phosphoribosylanthranilate isomerase [Desulfovibrionaceae bacterium]
MLIKICGLTRAEDVQVALDLGCDLAGFIFHPQSPRYIEPSVAASFDSGNMRRVGVFVTEDSDEILQIAKEARLDLIQLHGDQSEEVAQKIGPERVIRVLWPDRYMHKGQLYQAMCKQAHCAYYLLDAGMSRGGSGKTFDWAEISGIEAPHPWFLAGGLRAKNIVLAMQEFSPDGLDLNSGLEEAPGIKSKAKMEEAVNLIRQYLAHGK